jgi:lipopolysaccharide export system permease protein
MEVYSLTNCEGVSGMTIYRYIIRKHFVPFLYSFLTIMFLLVMQLVADLLQRILSKDLDPLVIGEVFLCNLGWMIVLAVPMAVLTATLMAFGGMSADNEIVAIKSSGKNLFYLMTPVMLAGAVVTVVLIFFYNLIYPEANHKAALLLADISRKRPVTLIEPKILIKDFKNYAIRVQDVNSKTGELKGIVIFANPPGEDPSTTVAEYGTVQTTRDGKYLELKLYNGETHKLSRENKEQYFVARFDRQVEFINNIDTEFHRSESEFRGDREMGARELLANVADFTKSKQSYLDSHNAELDSIVNASHRLDSLAAADTARVLPDSLTFGAWLEKMRPARGGAVAIVGRQGRALERTLRNTDREDRRISQYLVEVHKKFAIPIACIVFILIGAPLGIMARRGGFGTGVAYSIFFFILYWAFLIGGESMAERLILSPAVAMWSANVVLGICGLLLVLRMIRETTFISYAPLVRLWHGITTHKVITGSSRGGDAVRRILFGIPVWMLNKTAGILPAYCIRTFFSFVFMVFGALIVIFVVVDYISNLKRLSGLRLTDLGLYYWYYMPFFLQIVEPIGLLLASMFAMGRLTKYSEIIAMKAAGVSVRRLTMPLLFLGVAIFGLSFFLSEKILPEANARRKQLMEDIQAEKDAVARGISVGSRDAHRDFYFFNRDNDVYNFEEFQVNPLSATNVIRQKIIGNHIIERTQAAKMIYAKGKWSFISGSVRTFGKDTSTITTFDTLAEPRLTVTPEDMVKRIKSIEEMGYWELKDAIEKARMRGENVEKFLADLYFKTALPFMNFIVILLGISITVRAGRKGGAALFGLGLLITFSYWVMSRVGLAFGQDGRLDPFVAAWGGNVLFFLLGLVLYRRASQ